MTLARASHHAAMLGGLGRASRGPSSAYIAAARSTLAGLVAAAGGLELPELRREPGGYARTLLFGDDAVSIWAMVWDVGAQTPVHDHHCSCCFAVLRGQLREVSFRPVGGETALVTAETRLEAGAVRCMLPSGPNLHQMINRGTAEAISIHVYGFDHRRAASSVHREYRVAPQ